jgi:hypothetical protein
MADPTEINRLTAAQRDAIIAVHGEENVDVIPEGGGFFTVQIRFDDPPAAQADPGWANAPAMDQQDFHSKFGGQQWKYDGTGVFIEGADTPERSDGAPVTCSTIVSLYGRQILAASQAHEVPPELIVMTIAAEVGANRGSEFTGAPTFRWEARVRVTDVKPQRLGDYSAGPMQTLATTARSVSRRLHPGEDAFAVAPALATRPVPAPDTNPLYDAGLSIDLGTAVIQESLRTTGLDPILVAACYNHGGIGRSTDNPWHLFTTGDHLNRASQWYGDACAVIGPLRRGQALDPNSVKSPKLNVTSNDQAGAGSFELSHLTRETADFEAEFYRDSGANVDLVDDGGGLFTLRIQFQPSDPPAASGIDDLPGPGRDGYVVVINRIRTERRAATGAVRTIGSYQAYFDRQLIPGIGGIAVERPGPGNNGLTGRASKARLAAGLYPLFTHASGVGPGGRVKYRTFGFSTAVNVASRPWPAVRVENTGSRSGILMHCASGFLMSIGCINLASRLQGAKANINFSDSRSRVIALIRSMQQNLTDFPTQNNQPVRNAFLKIIGEP